MLGIADFPTAIAWIGVIASAVGGIVYAVIHWNDEGDISQSEQDAEIQWKKEDIEIDDEISGGSL